ncbi:MAG: aldose epimerase family protein [Acidimicrobiales bacterium]
MTQVVAIGRTTGHELQPPSEVRAYSIRSRGLRARLISLGATLDLVETPDREGRWEPVTMSLATLAEREDPELNPFIGQTIGRYANRIGGAAVEIDGHSWRLDANEGPNHLHGGRLGFGWFVWDADVAEESVCFHRISPAGEMGYPGTLETQVTYTAEPGRLAIEHLARVLGEATVVSMTNHAYWNLGGPTEPTVADHEVALPADAVVPVDRLGIPVGPPEPVDATVFDLRTPRRVGDLCAIPQLPLGLDHCLLPAGQGFRRHASIRHERSGRSLEIWSDQPATQVYLGGHLARTHAGLCIEPQQVPDAPARPWAPSPVLRPGELYRHRIELRFGGVG